jgi:hypothetical protein
MSTLPRTRRHGRTHIARCDEHAFRILFRAALEPVEPSPRCEERIMAYVRGWCQYTCSN